MLMEPPDGDGDGDGVGAGLGVGVGAEIETLAALAKTFLLAGAEKLPIIKATATKTTKDFLIKFK